MMVLFLCTFKFQAIERCHDTTSEVFKIPVSKTDSLYGFNLVVHALYNRVCRRIVEDFPCGFINERKGVEDFILPVGEGFGDVLIFGDLGCFELVDELFKERFSFVFVKALKRLIKAVFQLDRFFHVRVDCAGTLNDFPWRDMIFEPIVVIVFVGEGVGVFVECFPVFF